MHHTPTDPGHHLLLEPWPRNHILDPASLYPPLPSSPPPSRLETNKLRNVAKLFAHLMAQVIFFGGVGGVRREGLLEWGGYGVGCGRAQTDRPLLG